MSKEHFENERLYQATMAIARLLFEKGIISAEELLSIDTIMLEKYHPLLGSLYAGKTPL